MCCSQTITLGVSDVHCGNLSSICNRRHSFPVRQVTRTLRDGSGPERGFCTVRYALFRGAGNVFLGIAVGILGYYGITDAVTRGEQRELRSQAPSSMYATVIEEAGPALDFEGWEQEDAAYWDGLEPGEAFGRLVSPAMELDSVVVKGVARSDLKKGPGWIP